MECMNPKSIFLNSFMNVPKKAPFSQVISEKNLDRQTNRLKDR